MPENKLTTAQSLRFSWGNINALWAALTAVVAGVWLYSSQPTDSRLKQVKPPTKAHLDAQNKFVNRILSQRESPTIHLMWTTPPNTFTLLNYKVLDSYLYHDPTTKFVIHATHLNTSHFISYLHAGYNITINPISDSAIWSLATTPTPDAPEACPGQRWLERIEEYRKTSPYFYSHLTDYLRFCILYKYGGVYSDFDAIQLSKWNIPQERSTPPVPLAFIGADSASGAPPREMGSSHPSGPSNCTWCFYQDDKYLAPGVMGTPPGHLLVKTALEIGFERNTYDPMVFNAVGPKAVTLAYQELNSKGMVADVEVLRRPVLYPYSYLTSWKVFKAAPGAANKTNTGGDGEAGGESLIKKGLSLHLYGHKTKGMVAENGSVLDYIVRKQSVIKRNYEFGGLNITDVDPVNDVPSKTPNHKLRVPRFLGISKYIHHVPDVRILVDTRHLEVAKVETESLLLTLKIAAKHGKVRLASTNLKDQSAWKPELVFSNVSPAIANLYLSRLMYQINPSLDRDNITVTAAFLSTTLQSTIPIYNLPSLLTIMIKTTDRMSKVFSLVTSILEYHPNITTIVTDDGHVDPAKSTRPEGPQRGFYYLPLPHDVGLSAGRNRMVERIRTPYVLTLDDDFTINQDSDFTHLLHALETPPKHNPSTLFSIAAGKIPADEGRFGIDYCGLMTQTPSRTLRLDAGRVTPGLDHEGCIEVDFVPNVFVARTDFLRTQLRWDETLKLGEHEDFFWRAKQMGARTLTCPSVRFYHDQVAHWKGVTDYDKKRARVFDFWKVALRKHGFVRLVSFGRIVMDLVLPKPIESLQVTNVLSRSVYLTWISSAASFKILQSSNGGLNWAPVNQGQGENYEHVPHRISKALDGFQRPEGSENWITVYGLRPGVEYKFRIHAGNRFLYLEGGVETSVVTLTAETEKERNLLQNPSFETGSTSPYVISRNNTYGLVPISSVDNLGQTDYTESSLLKYRRTSHTGFRSEITTVGYMLRHRSLASLSQFIPAVPHFINNKKGTKILVSMHSRIDALFDVEEGMSWRVNVKVWFSKLSPSIAMSDKYEEEEGEVKSAMLEWGPADMEVKEEFDRSVIGWQGRTICICVGEGGWMGRVIGVEVSGVLETFRGSVTWDEWVVVIE
ncbi:hypothetical protein BCR33DRAFT_717005 [Rhizoclosmatium globosum]|uniref:Fibronectin type-III domain-containing protein n=1 Tax=Rhizoclosmatium globosum TaxID=329046 RepID=A0A1Y2CBU0_9FUNG|nr:hypothetical protein BCR33DRAFT_717005 [Rhizoclosmatium globosum]|eukprot:ORY44498.1 hypothetical protein BCR33DRAFT_717005 [Rhizoclosmatium globosum]